MALFQYWFSLTPPPLSGAREALWGMMGAASVVVALLVFRVVLPKVQWRGYQRAWTQFGWFAGANGVVLMALLFFRSEGVPVFGARFWVLLLAGIDLAWGLWWVHGMRVRIPAQRVAQAGAEAQKKYLQKKR
ncbi:hypothetical protein HYV74_01845 [Candidatus Uhrbacteria bacterium]|nr:hypothetical protein [Candidatus Uhrbacteria bacterium]